MAQDIRKVNSIESLMSYFSEKLAWDIDPDSFYDIDDITYEFDAEDLGLKEEAFAKIISLKQLRPMVDNQKWGIFFVEFDSRRFEVSALRKILSGLVPTRRNSAEHAVWDMRDLLFLCTWGSGNNVTIGAAHFEDADKGLPQIKMISCEPAVEDFTQVNTFEQRLAKLHWPSDPSDTEAWREAWSSAFTVRYRQVIQDAHTLTIRLAEEAQHIRNLILDILKIETRNGYVHLLFEKFQNTLIHDMTEQQFADMYAQTIVYGLFSARCMDRTQNDFSAVEAVSCIPNTNPFLKSLMQECLSAEHTSSKLSFDELEIGNIVTLLRKTRTDAIIADFNRQTGGGREDPVIHFYEEFLSEYDKAQKVQRGVYYTPQPIVNFIVRAVDDILKSEFGISDGLASTETKQIKIKRQSKRKQNGLYREVEDTEEVPAIQILDPATGTGTFLRQTILQIYQNFCGARKGMTNEQIQQEWNTYVPEHLLPRLNGFELMIAPYAVAHMKLAMVLKDTGYDFHSDERLKVYLTNTLEEPGDSELQTNMYNDPLATESIEANAAKKNNGINVVIGNPPYSNSSVNRNEWILELISLYKEGLNERKLNLDEDSIKFIRYGQFICDHAENSILAYISNNSFLNGVTHRKMRFELLRSFNKVYIINLHGDSNRLEKCPDGSKDENVFDIQQGVSIHIFIKNKRGDSTNTQVNYLDIYGTQHYKLNILGKSSISDFTWDDIKPVAPYYFFDNKDYSETTSYEKGFSVADLFLEKNTGIQTKNDSLTLQPNEEAISALVKDFCSMSEKDISVKYGIKSGGTWTIEAAKADLMRNKYQIIPVLFRPFDIKYTVLTDKSGGFLGRPRYSTMIQMCLGFSNYALLVGRQNKSDSIDSFLVTDLVSEMKCAERTIQSYHLPVFIAERDIQRNIIRPKANYSHEIVKTLEESIGCKMDWYEYQSEDGFTAIDVLDYIYAILYSEDYRTKYKNQLKIDFPKIPFPKDKDYFFNLVSYGRQLRALHLMHNSINTGLITYDAVGNSLVEIPRYKSGSIIINKSGSKFKNVPIDIWNMGLGGYQPLQKWLKDRKGNYLSTHEIEHYKQIVAILMRTKEIVSKIDI